MEKKQKTSLTWQLILTMVVIVAGTVAMCWFFNTTFLEKYYIFHKEKELKSSFDQVRLICEKQGDSSDDAYVQFEKICANGNINMLIADQDRNLIWSSYSSAQRFQMQMEDWLYGSDRSRVQVLSSGKDYTLLRQTDERLQSEYLVLLGTLKNGNNLYMRAAVESIRESASITNQFFVMVSTGAIILSVILIIVLSKGISHPIHALSDIARRMTQLDFDAKYIPVRHVSREIDELGNSMNELSETLEETISELKTANVSLQQDIEKKEQIDEMRKEFLSNVSHELMTLQRQADLLLVQASSATESLGDGDDTEKSAMIVKKIFELVKENKAITREELASQVFLSPDYMAKVFKKETGKRISDYLSEVRLQEAKCLLTDTTRSISDIASSLSYSNFSGFSRMFKSETGLSPAEYRKKHRKAL